MVNDDRLLRPEERVVLQQLANQPDIDGQRAAALLALDSGATQAAAAEESGLTVNQVRYIVQKFRSDRLLVFPDALGLLPSDDEPSTAEAPAQSVTDQDTQASAERRGQLNRLLAQINELVDELRAILPDGGQYPYSPLQMLALVRDTAARYTPDAQLAVLEPFEDMTPEDLLDPDTWKGIAYMIAYSAQFQASQTKDVLNERLPDPIKLDTVYQNVRGGLDRITPDVAKEMIANLEGASREDLLDPETWKGMAYMIAYSAQFQAGQVKDQLNEQMPDPLKPDTIFELIKNSLDRFTPETAKQILASFEGATKEDLLDPDTWKGVWYMLNYSLQFQAEQLKQRLSGEPVSVDEEE